MFLGLFCTQDVAQKKDMIRKFVRDIEMGVMTQNLKNAEKVFALRCSCRTGCNARVRCLVCFSLISSVRRAERPEAEGRAVPQNGGGAAADHDPELAAHRERIRVLVLAGCWCPSRGLLGLRVCAHGCVAGYSCTRTQNDMKTIAEELQAQLNKSTPCCLGPACSLTSVRLSRCLLQARSSRSRRTTRVRVHLFLSCCDS